jgi:hypothetical protein
MAQADLDVSRIARIGVMLVLVIVGAVAVATVLNYWLPVSASTPDATPLAPLAESSARLLSAPQPVRQKVREHQLERLHSSGWVDRAHGIAHIPIDAAMALIAERSAAHTGAAKAAR